MFPIDFTFISLQCNFNTLTPIYKLTILYKGKGRLTIKACFAGYEVIT